MLLQQQQQQQEEQEQEQEQQQQHQQQQEQEQEQVTSNKQHGLQCRRGTQCGYSIQCLSL